MHKDFVKEVGKDYAQEQVFSYPFDYDVFASGERSLSGEGENQSGSMV